MEIIKKGDPTNQNETRETSTDILIIVTNHQPSTDNDEIEMRRVVTDLLRNESNAIRYSHKAHAVNFDPIKPVYILPRRIIHFYNSGLTPVNLSSERVKRKLADRMHWRIKEGEICLSKQVQTNDKRERERKTRNVTIHIRYINDATNTQI